MSFGAGVEAISGGDLDAQTRRAGSRSAIRSSHRLAGGDAIEIWELNFINHGFQYVELTGWLGTPSPDNFDVRVVHTEVATVGKLKVAQPIFGRLHAATRWSFRSNVHSIPTDGSHREKNGWTGDAHLAVMASLYNFDVAPAYRKWIADFHRRTDGGQCLARDRSDGGMGG